MAGAAKCIRSLEVLLHRCLDPSLRLDCYPDLLCTGIQPTAVLPGCASVREDAGGFLWYGRGFVRNAYLVVVVIADSSHLGR